MHKCLQVAENVKIGKSWFMDRIMANCSINHKTLEFQTSFQNRIGLPRHTKKLDILKFYDWIEMRSKLST